jgi:uncharacterized membrane protein
MKLISHVGSLILATVLTAAPVACAQYSAYDLGTLGGLTSFAYGINSGGTIVGSATTSPSTSVISRPD